MDPVSTKISTTLPDPSNSQAGGQSGKNGASKFDTLRNQLQAKDGTGVSSTDSISSATPSAANMNPNVDRVQHGSATTPERVHQSLAATQHHLARLRERIESGSPTSSMQGLQARLTSAEQQYMRLSSAVNSLPANASPQQWLVLQQQAYSMNENIGVLSKMVGQAANGVKTVLQTQV